MEFKFPNKQMPQSNIILTENNHSMSNEQIVTKRVKFFPPKFRTVKRESVDCDSSRSHKRLLNEGLVN